MPTASTRHFRIAAPIIAVTVIGIAGIGLAQPDRRGGGPSLEQSMKEMNRAAQSLQTSISDASKKEENLKLIWAMERAEIQAKATTPRKLPGDKDKMLAEYRKAQIELLKLIVKLESETLDGKTNEASQTLAAIMQAKTAGHEKFGVKGGK